MGLGDCRFDLSCDRVWSFFIDHQSCRSDGALFVAVVFVIIGTYLIFTTGSITLLKLLEKTTTSTIKPLIF